jgi:tetratricopeptide (TPR) repeat protein
VNPPNHLAYGVIGDAQVELGDYEAGRAAYDKMASLRPDINSYSRISYMRELLGDTDGAIKAMSLATRVGLANTEPSNWARVQLGHLYFNSGRLEQAEALYQASLNLYPDYIHALGGMGKVRAARGDYKGATEYYRRALSQIPIPEYVIALGDAYAAAGNTEEAQKQYALVGAIQQLYQSNGVDTDLEIALFNADHRIAPAQTVAQAQAAYERRPSIFAADVVAWALYQTGDYHEAEEFSQKALQLGMQDALKYFHAGMIAHQLGDKERAREYLERALEINPHFSLRYAPLARATLETIP